jgi:hypothetical protein
MRLAEAEVVGREWFLLAIFEASGQAGKSGQLAALIQQRSVCSFIKRIAPSAT